MKKSAPKRRTPTARWRALTALQRGDVLREMAKSVMYAAENASNVTLSDFAERTRWAAEAAGFRVAIAVLRKAAKP